MVIVEYDGFLQHIKREFETLERATQWLRQVGKDKDLSVKITEDEKGESNV